MSVYYTTGTIGTALNHPHQGKTQLFRRNLDGPSLAKLFANPREHTGVGYKTVEEREAREAKTCHNCGGTGHLKRDCPAPLSESEASRAPSGKSCFNCGGTGHIKRDCTAPATETLPEAAAQGLKCYNCRGRGHFAADCKTFPPFFKGCYNCGNQGHKRADCPEEQN